MRITLDIPLSAEDIAKAVGGSLKGVDKGTTFRSLSTDTRELKKNDLFFALSGKKFNGECFLENAYTKGAIPVTVQKDVRGIFVSDTASALLSLAKAYKQRLKKLKHTVAVTGSVGKTTTKEFLGILLSGKYKIHKTSENENNNIGLPLTILSAPADTEILILEMGMNHNGEISVLSRCASPDIAVITNIGTSHIGNLGSRENIAKAKLEILDSENIGCLIVPAEEPLLSSVPKRYTFSVVDPFADIYIIYNEGSIMIFNHGKAVEANTGLSAPHHINCLCASICTALKCGISADDLIKRISLISAKNTRQNIISVNNYYILSDFYNASLESVSQALSQLKSLCKNHEASALLGDIYELGDMSEAIHRKIGKECAEAKLSKLYLFGKEAKYIRDEAIKHGMSEDNIFLNEDINVPEITADAINKNHSPNELILFKASRAARLERILDLLQKTTREGEK